MTWKRFAILCTSAILFLFPRFSSQACGWSEEGDWYYRFFSPELLTGEDELPFNYTWDKFYDYNWQEEWGEDDNVNEWRGYFKGKVSREDVEEIIYATSWNDWEQIQKYMNGQAGRPDWAGLEDNGVIDYIKSKKDNDFVTYMIFAKRIEPMVYTGSEYDWPKIDNESYATLTQEMMAAYPTIKSDFLKLRIGFQIVRLAHYTDRNSEVLRLYDQYVAGNKTNSMMQGWALGHKAGALRDLKREAEAAYAYSRVFATTPSKRPQAWQSFRIKSDQVWADALALCADDAEKAVLYAIRAINPSAMALEDIEKMYELDPKSPMLGLMLVREINKLEEDVLGFGFNDVGPVHTGYFGFSEEAGLERLARLHKLVKEVQANNSLPGPTLWSVADVYLTFMKGEFQEVERMTKELVNEPAYTEERVAEALRLISFVNDVTQTKKLDKATEDRLYEEAMALSQVLPEEKKNMPLNYMEDVFYRLYKEHGMPAKALLASSAMYLLQEAPSHPLIIDLESWVLAPGKGKYEQHLLKRFSQGASFESLAEIRGTLYLADMKLDKAIMQFEKVSQAGLPTIGPDVFKFKIHDRINCWNNPECEEGTLNKLELAKLLKNMLKLAEETPSRAAEYYALIGTAYYNMSYYGNGWSVLDYGRSSYNWTQKEEKPSVFPRGWKGIERTDVSIAMEYFQKAIQASTDPETSALAVWGAAKCEQAAYWTSEDFSWGFVGYNAGYGNYFSQLKNNYSNTEFYEAVLNECMYFANYVNGY